MKPLFMFGIKLTFTALVIGLVLAIVGWGEVVAALAEASLPWLLVMYGLKLLRQVIDAVQFRFLTRRVGLDLTLGRIFLASQLASLYSLVLPGELAASTAKWANLSIATGARSAVLNAMVYMKLLFLAVPAFIGAVALAIDNPLGSWWVVAVAWSIIAVIVFAMVALYHPAMGPTVDRWGLRLTKRLPASLGTKMDHVFRSMARVRDMSGRSHVTLLGFMSLGVAVEISRFYSGIRALGLDVPLTGVLWILAFVGVARLMPLTIANLGIREGLLVFALSAFDAPAQQAVALGLLGFSTVVLLALIGAGYQVALVTGLASVRTDRSASEVAPTGGWPGSPHEP